MTHLIIHSNPQLRNDYLLQKVNALLNSDYKQISQLFTLPDVHYIDNTEFVSIKIEEVKELQKSMILLPFEAKYQIGIIFNSQMLTIEAQNALLKTLEEVSETTVYFLTVNNERSLLPTIVSRSIKHYVVPEKNDTRGEIIEKQLDLPQILRMPLVEQFQEIEKLNEMEKSNKGAINDLIMELMNYYRQQLQEGMRNGDAQTALNAVRIVESANIRLNANVNKRLLLENMVLQLAVI